MRYKIKLSYDGTDFCGWQSQPDGKSVQDALENAIARLFGERVRAVGSGRTDAGVHALAQVAHFDCEKVLPFERVVGGLNAYLPRSVRVLDACAAADGFDARKSAKRKTYMYLMYRGAPLPVLNDRALCVGDRFDTAAANNALKAVIGTHDFATFKAAGSNAKTSTRTVFDAHVDDDGRFIKFFITADGFLYNMVRIIAAQVLKTARGETVDIAALIAAKDRTLAKDTAPACALYLYDVAYDKPNV